MGMIFTTKKFQTPQMLLAFCLIASSGILLGALGFEHIGGLAPCKLCIWQRWPHLAIILIAAIGLIVSNSSFAQNKGLISRICCAGIAMAALITAAIGLYHVGVEQLWWDGPSGCSSQLNTNLDLSSLTDTLLATPVIRCDEIAWQLFGISMAGWNMLLSLVIAGVGVYGLIDSVKQRP